MRLPPDVWALLDRAMQGARNASGRALSDAAALAAVARDALAAQQITGAADLQRAVIIHECQHCSRAELKLDSQPADLNPDTAASLGCGAPIVVGGEYEGGLPASVRRAVLARDGCQCRVPGCHRRRYVDVHPISSVNHARVSPNGCVTVCERHHRALHEGEIRVTGDAASRGGLDWTFATGPIDSNGMPPNEPSLETLARATHSGSDAGNTAGASEASDDIAAPMAPTTFDGPKTDTASEPGSVFKNGQETPRESFDDIWKRFEPDASQLLAIMGRRGGWNPDMLCEASGLPIPRVLAALTALTISGDIWRDPGGSITPRY